MSCKSTNVMIDMKTKEKIVKKNYRDGESLVANVWIVFMKVSCAKDV